jgi:hypothetical protein
MFRRVSWIVAFVLALSALNSAPVSASSAGAATYAYHVGDALIQALGFPVGDKAMASVNGDVVTVVATGTFDTATRAATGGGTFWHRSSGGTLIASGTFTTAGMESFQFYGCGVLEGNPVPPTWCGGRVQLTGVATAHPAGHPEITFHLPIVLTIECVIGDPVAGATEGIRVNVQDLINFNKTVPESGANVFIRQ